jgi:5,10-methylenetetrahydromethanopterin reductase
MMGETLELGVSLMVPSHDTRAAVSVAREAEDAGLDHVAVPDSPHSFPETFLTTQAVLAATRRLTAGPAVINPVTRTSEDVRAAMSVLAVDHPGRVSLAVGRGESAVKASGRRSASTSELERYVRDLRVEESGTWRPPIATAAAGPRTIAAAARSSDVVLLDVGVSVDAIERAIGLIRREAERTEVESPAVWTLARGVVGEDLERGRLDLAGLVSASAGRLAGADDWKRIPAELTAPIDAFASEYMYASHGVWDDAMRRRKLARMGELAIEDFLFDRFALVGTPQHVAARLQELERLGISRVIFSGAVPALPELVTRLGADVGPLIRSAQ